MISVIVPVYNVEQYLPDCIRSILCQTYQDFELILVDDCGLDRSIEIAEGILKEDAEVPWRIIHHQKNRGLSASRNTGVSVAQGDYLLFVDSDDYLAENCLSGLVAGIEEFQSDLVIGNFAHVFEDGRIVAHRFPSKDRDGKRDAFSDYLSGHMYPMAWNKLIRRSFYLAAQVQFREGWLHEDEAWSFELTLKQPKVIYTDEVTYYYRHRGESITADNQISRERLKSRFALVKLMLEYSDDPICKQSDQFPLCLADRALTVLTNIESCGDLSFPEKIDYYRKFLALKDVSLQTYYLGQERLLPSINLLRLVMPVEFALFVAHRVRRWGSICKKKLLIS